MENPQAAVLQGAAHLHPVAFQGTAFLAPTESFKAIVYAAEARVAFNDTRLNEFAAAGAERRERLGLTGHAYAHGGRLIEYIEGPADAVDEAYAAIESDARFIVRQSAEAESLARRRFNGWELESCGAELMELRLEHVLETILQNLTSALFGRERNLSAIWRLVDAIARRHSKPAKPVGAGSTRLVFAH
jgi:hypothetical protein